MTNNSIKTTVIFFIILMFRYLNPNKSEEAKSGAQNPKQIQMSSFVGWIKRSESTMYKNIFGGFGAKTSTLIHPTICVMEYVHGWSHEYTFYSLRCGMCF